MAWRVIIRFSLDNDTGSIVRNAIAPILNECGVQRTTTGTWESPHVDAAALEQQLAKMLRILADPISVANAPPLVALDHLWVYIDKG